MRKYRTIARIHLMHSLQYRANLLGGFAMYAMFLFVFFCLWRTIYAAGAPEDYTIAQMIWYLCITELISFGTRTNVFTEIAQDVKNGQVAYQLTRPYSYLSYRLSGALGGMTAAPDAPVITVASVDARAETLTVCSKNGVSFALVPTGSVENFSALLKKIAPDLVHIWGTEYAAARTIQQAAQAAGIPVLVGIQGVMVDCALHLNDGVPARLLHSCAAQHLIDRHVPGGHECCPAQLLARRPRGSFTPYRHDTQGT